MIDLLHNWTNTVLRRDKVTPYPFGETTAVISSIILGITGLIIFSYYAQSASCINYNDWRRKFSTIALFAVLIIMFMYSMVYIGSFVINYKIEGDSSSGIEYNSKSLFSGIALFLFTLFILSLFGRSIDLTLKPEIEYSNLPENHPAQYWLTIFISGFLILGSTLPLTNYVGQKIINPPATIIQL